MARIVTNLAAEEPVLVIGVSRVVILKRLAAQGSTITARVYSNAWQLNTPNPSNAKQIEMCLFLSV